MKIALLDKFFEKDIYTYRTCKIKYAYAFESCIKDKLLLLKKKYNVYSIDELFADTYSNSQHTSKFKSWIIGLVKNLLGLHPNYGAIFTVIFSLTDTISFLKRSDLEKLRERVQLKEKQRKKYKKLKNIILIKNSSYLNLDENKIVRLIMELINKKYIVNTLLIICEPLDFPSNLIVNENAIYTFDLDNEIINEIFGFTLENNYLKLVNVLGIEYTEYIKNLGRLTSQNIDLLMQKLISDLLQRAGCDEEENLLDFLKLCSLLFDSFSYEDIETISKLKKINCEVELQKSVLSKIIENPLPNEYRFFIEYLRKYYQENAQFYSSQIKRQILDYLKEKYPNKYTDLALASILTSNCETEKISFCLKSLYYDNNTTTIYKRTTIIDYLSNTEYLTLTVIPRFDNIYYSLDYSEEETKNLCMQSFLGLLDLNFLSVEDRLICLNSIAKVSYEIMPQEFLKEIDELYRNLLRDLHISSTYKQYTSFILDYLVFSTCIENSYKTTEVVQRLVSYIEKTQLPLQTKIKFLRLGNALFYNDYNDGLKLTMQAYNLSEGYPIEHKYAAINCSCSLGMCGKYESAYNILFKEFGDTFYEQNAISISATNNYIIVSYLSGLKDAKWFVNNQASLNRLIIDKDFSDQQIIYNNLLAAYIEENYLLNGSIIKEISDKIYSTEKDVYHLFFMHHNMMVYHFLCGNLDDFMHEYDLCCIPSLLSPYSDFFISKANFLQNNIYNQWDIKQLQQQLSDWGKHYTEPKYSLYKYPILYGFIERWFE